MIPLARGEGVSEWSDTTFRAEVELIDDAGKPAGTLNVAGTYVSAGAGERTQQKFNDGNIHVVMDHTGTPVSASGASALFNGAAWQVDEAAGWHLTGYLFVSNPATYVGSGEVVAITEWKGENVTEFYNDERGTLTETGLYRQYADDPNASGCSTTASAPGTAHSDSSLQKAARSAVCPRPRRLPLAIRWGVQPGTRRL